MSTPEKILREDMLWGRPLGDICLVGSGGNPDRSLVGYLLHSMDSTGAVSLTGVECIVDAPKKEVPAAPRDMLALVRRTFCLTVTDAARVFHVMRPTIYQWSNLDDPVRIRAERNFERMRSLYSIALNWPHACVPMPEGLKLVLSDGATLLDLLSAIPLDIERIERARRQLVSRVAELAEARKLRNRRYADALGSAVQEFGNKDSLKEAIARELDTPPQDRHRTNP